MTVLDNVAFSLESRPGPRAEKRRRALRFVESVGLGAFAALYPHELSVGMRQKAAIARAFLRDPRVLLMDEPLASLDFQTRLLMREELLKIWTGSRRAVVFVTHDIEEAILLGDRLLVMTGRPGRIREEIAIPLPRPRRLEDGAGPAAAEIKWRVWRSLEDEARLSMASLS
jgi:NitT/TauT family transport system ATP-binding protein